MHVIQRGNNRSACFQREVDYAVYLRLLAEGRSAAGEIEDAVSRMMKRVGENYVRYFNRAYERSGTLWEGRFRSSIVDSEHYLLATIS